MKQLGMIVILLVFTVAGVLAQDRGEMQLQAAIKMELFDGNLKGAIEHYKKIIATRGAGRTVVAKALLQLGGCYEKQGNAEARKTFEQLLKDYADQTEIAAQARTRIGVKITGFTYPTVDQARKGRHDNSPDRKVGVTIRVRY